MQVPKVGNSKFQITYNLIRENVSISGPMKRSENEEQVADLLDEYYTDGLCKKWGIGDLIAIFELIPAFLLVMFLGSPATKTNLITSLGEYLQVWLGRTKLFGNPKVDKKELRKMPEFQRADILNKANNAQERREGIMAWLQILAGLLGFSSFALEKIKSENEVEDLSVQKRASLSTASLLSSIFMLSGYLEKNLIAAIASRIKGTTEHNNMRMNASNDGRCCIEWLSMAFLPWFQNTLSWIPNNLRTLIDIGIPLLALKEGASHFVNKGDKKDGDEEKGKSIPSFARWRFFLEIVRDKLFIPILNLFKAKPPVCYYKGNNLICELDGGIYNTKQKPQASNNDLQAVTTSQIALQLSNSRAM